METITVIFERHTIDCELNQSGVYVGSMGEHSTVWLTPKLDGTWSAALTTAGYISEMPDFGKGRTPQEAFDDACEAAGYEPQEISYHDRYGQEVDEAIDVMACEPDWMCDGRTVQYAESDFPPEEADLPF